MGTLNIVNKSPFEKRTLEQCLSRIGEGDSLLLIEDAVVAALGTTTIADTLAAARGHSPVYVLTPDLAMRGLADKALIDGIGQVDYAGFVELVTTHDRVHSWL